MMGNICDAGSETRILRAADPALVVGADHERSLYFGRGGDRERHLAITVDVSDFHTPNGRRYDTFAAALVRGFVVEILCNGHYSCLLRAHHISLLSAELFARSCCRCHFWSQPCLSASTSGVSKPDVAVEQ